MIIMMAVPIDKPIISDLSVVWLQCPLSNFSLLSIILVTWWQCPLSSFYYIRPLSGMMAVPIVKLSPPSNLPMT